MTSIFSRRSRRRGREGRVRGERGECGGEGRGVVRGGGEGLFEVFRGEDKLVLVNKGKLEGERDK